MQIKSIGNINFGIKYSRNMSNLLYESEKIADKKGESVEWDKAAKEINEALPGKYKLFTREVKEDNSTDIILENPDGYKYNILKIKTGDVLDKDKMVQIKNKLVNNYFG